MAGDGDQEPESCKVCESIWPKEATPGEVCNSCCAPRDRWNGGLNPYYLDVEADAENLCMKMGEYILRFESEEFGAEYEEKARLELREDPETTKAALAELREILKGDPDLDVPWEEDKFLLTFLRPCHMYAKSAYQRMQNYFKFKVRYPKYCLDLKPSRERNIFKQGLLTVFPVRDNGRRILLIEAGKKWKPKNVTLDEIFKGVMLILEAAISEPRTQVSGVSVVLDMDGLALNHVWQFTPGFAKAVVDWVQECIPVRLKSVHVVNQPYVFNMLFAIFKPLLQEKLRKRIFFHGTDRQSFMSHFDAKSIPLPYGGEMDLPEFQGELLCELLSNYDEYYEARNRNGYTKA